MPLLETGWTLRQRLSPPTRGFKLLGAGERLVPARIKPNQPKSNAVAKNICGRVEEAMKETCHGAKTPEGPKKDVTVHKEYIAYFGTAKQVASTESPKNESGGTRNQTSVPGDLAPSYPQDPILDPEEDFDFERDISVTQLEEIDRMISGLSQQKADESVSDLLERINQWYLDLPASLDSIPKDSLLVKAVYDKCSEEFFDKFLFNFDAEDFEYDYLVERLFEVEEELRKEKSLSRHPVHPPNQCTKTGPYWASTKQKH